MLAKWTEILPLFVIRDLAIKHCQQIHLSNSDKNPLGYAIARPGVLIKVE